MTALFAARFWPWVVAAVLLAVLGAIVGEITGWGMFWNGIVMFCAGALIGHGVARIP